MVSPNPPFFMATMAPARGEVLLQTLLAHAEDCKKADLERVELSEIVEDLKDAEKEEAEFAKLEQDLEDAQNALFVKNGVVLALERDIDTVEKRLSRATEDQALALAEVKRLRADLVDVEASNQNLKRRLEALGGDAKNGYGLSSGGLHLMKLDLVNCCVVISNKTNMDVSLDGWTVRVISGRKIFENDGFQQQTKDGGVMIKSPGSEMDGQNRRDSIGRRRHTFVFPFDFMLAAGSEAIIRWGPEFTDYGDLNQFHWERPLDFDVSDIGTVTGENIDPLAQQGKVSFDPDEALKEGSLCLVDPNGVVSFTIPLMNSDSQEVPLLPYDTSSNVASYSPSLPPPSSSAPHIIGSSTNLHYEQNNNVKWAESPVFSPGAQVATENIWATTQKAVLATPRRLGSRFAEVMQQSAVPRRWASNPIPETPLHEPNIPESCAIM